MEGVGGAVGYISAREHSQVSVIIFTKIFQCKTLCPVPAGVPFSRIHPPFVDLQIRKINRTLATL